MKFELIMEEIKKEEIKIMPTVEVYGITQEELRKRINLYNSHVTADPYRDYNKLSPWSIIGSWNEWRIDIPMYTYGTYGIGWTVCKAIKLEAGDEFKFRCKRSWMINLGAEENDKFIPYKFGGGHIDLQRNGKNIKVEESGLYTITLDITLAGFRSASIMPFSGSIDDIPEKMALWYNERNKIMNEAFRLKSLREEWIRASKENPEKYKLVIELPEVEDYDSSLIKFRDRLYRDWKNINPVYINSDPEKK